MAMTNNFTQKEMLIRVIDKLDKIEDKLGSTHEQVKTTNGKVKLHTKLIWSLGGIILMIIGWIISINIK